MGVGATVRSLRAAWLVSDPSALAELYAQVEQAIRQRVMRALDVGPQELDELLGDDADALASLDELVATLERQLKTGRLPDVARRPAPVFGGRSLLGVIRDGELDLAAGAVRESFRWEDPA